MVELNQDKPHLDVATLRNNKSGDVHSVCVEGSGAQPLTRLFDTPSGTIQTPLLHTVPPAVQVEYWF